MRKPDAAARATAASVRAPEVLEWLRAHGSARVRDGMARYAIPADRAVGVTVGALRQYAKRIGRDHALALELWKTGVYEARMLACFVDDPTRVTPAQMDRWCRSFDNWAICDTACFHLFDRTPHAFGKIAEWAARTEEFIKRGAFALLASVALHDKGAKPESLARCLPLVEKAATDGRNFVKKSVSWALRSVGRRAPLHERSVALARRLAASKDPAARWVGRDALRDLTKPAVAKRVAGPTRTARARRDA